MKPSSVSEGAPALIGAESRPPLVLLAGMGWVVRNYLLGDFLPVIQQHQTVVVFSPMADDPAFRETFEEKGLQVERLMPHVKQGRRHGHALARKQLYHFTWCGTESMKVKLRRGRTWYNPLQNFHNHVEQKIAQVITGPRLLRAVDRIEQRYALQTEAARYYEQQFARLKPALVFSAAPLLKNEWIPVQVARTMGIRTAAAVLSWDNLTTKSRFATDFDHYVVWSEKMKRDLMTFYPDVQPARISVCGTPQFDYHCRPDVPVSRAVFCQRLGLDPARPLLVYSGVTPTLMPDEPEIVAGLIEAIRAGRIEGRPQVLLRLHPKDDGARYAGFRDRFPEVCVSIPGAQSAGDVRRWKPSLEDVHLLTNTILHGDVHLNVASTISIDAAILDRPVVNIRYTVSSADEQSALGLKIYDYTHYRPIVASGGVRVAASPDELVAHINAYLADPSADRAGRRKIVEMECGVLDGHAGERIANRLVDLTHRWAREAQPS